MNPLIITATPNNCWLHPDVPYPKSLPEIVEEAKLCEQNGASVLHIHAEGRWRELIEALRRETNLIIQCGMSSLPIPERMEVFEAGADMISIILSHHDEAFAELDVHVLHPRDELIEYAQLCATHGVRPEWEVWHSGSIWNLNYLIDRGVLRTPHVTTLFFGWPGGSWSPATLSEYTYRRSLLPEGCVATVSIMGAGQARVVAGAVVEGDHVRVGTEDHPLDRSGSVSPTHRLVAEAAEVSRSLGRVVARPDEARKLLGIGGQ